jgi:hypothetical protein
MKYVITENMLVGIVYGFSFGIAYTLGVKFANTIFFNNNLIYNHSKQVCLTHRKKLTKSDVLLNEYVKWKQSKKNYTKVIAELKEHFRMKEMSNLSKQLEDYDKIRLEEVKNTRQKKHSNTSSTKDIKSLFDALL